MNSAVAVVERDMIDVEIRLHFIFKINDEIYRIIKRCHFANGV